VTINGNPNDLSDRLAQALGISGDRVRAAMLATIQADMPSPPPDPMAAIAAQLGLPTEQVCAAFFDGAPTGGSVAVSEHRTIGVTRGSETTGHPSVMIGVNGTTVDLGSATADQLRGPAQRLGVTPERLQAAVRAAVAALPAPPSPPSSDEIIRRFASNLGLSEDTVRAAIAKVEGTGRFYFAVPLPSFGH
jgi:predicted PhzF superfamily epimerase YddE/YHI9